MEMMDDVRLTLEESLKLFGSLCARLNASFGQHGMERQSRLEKDADMRSAWMMVHHSICYRGFTHLRGKFTVEA